jgi:glycerophosphoryl diester phosphodiesterase
MTIIEQTLVPKNPTKKSEDGIVVTDDFIAVIDGSTSKTTRRHNRRMSNGRYAMTIVADYISHMAANTSCRQFCVGVTAAIRKRYLPFWKRDKQAVIDHLQQHPEERLCASAAVYSRLRREVWLVGDCQCLIGNQLYENPKPHEQKLAEQRAEKIQQLLAEGMTVNQILSDDIARQSVIPQMLEDMKQQNVTYAVIDGFPIPQQRVPVISLDFQPWEVVLATDGYPFLCPTLQESEEKLRRQHDTDPLNVGQFKATKGFTPGNNSFDDRTYIRFMI